MKKKVSIVGASGYTGFELVKILIKHKNVELKHLAVRRDPAPVYSEIFPQLKGVCDIQCCSIDTDLICKDSDIIFFALPHKISMDIIPKFMNKGKKLIDLSADYRIKDIEVYKKAYDNEHKDKENLEKFIYGLCEINNDKIKDAENIANPGCFPTSILLALAPVLKEKLIDINNIIIDSKTGVSGGGNKPCPSFHFPECNESIKPYKIVEHQHEPEIVQELSLISEADVKIIFVPHLIPITRGILSTIYVNLVKEISEDEIRDLYKKYYEQSFFVRILEKGIYSEVKNIANTNFCDISFKKKDNNLIIVSAIDNLIKGASGQAVQNMNIMCGFDEEDGLI